MSIIFRSRITVSEWHTNQFYEVLTSHFCTMPKKPNNYTPTREEHYEFAKQQYHCVNETFDHFTKGEVILQVLFELESRNQLSYDVPLLSRCIDVIRNRTELVSCCFRLINLFAPWNDSEVRHFRLYNYMKSYCGERILPGYDAEIDYRRTLSVIQAAIPDYMHFCVRYGISYRTIQDNEHERDYVTLKLAHRFYNVIDELAFESVKRESMMDCLSLVRNSVQWFDDSHHMKSPRRTLVVLFAIDAFYTEKAFSSNVDTIFRLYFRTISEPYVTVTEVEEFLNTVTQGKDCDVVRKICEQFMNIFPESNCVYEPRSLVHLSRCQVRTSLREARLITPEIYFVLDIPVSLQEFLAADRNTTYEVPLTNHL